MANISIPDIPLICHSQCDDGGIEGITAGIWRTKAGEIRITYRVSGALDQLEIAGPAPPDRADGLWKTTCFELFVSDTEDANYIEYNFATSGQWAAYAFSGYRKILSDLTTDHPEIIVDQVGSTLTVAASFQLPTKYREVDLLAGISAVLATKRGNVSYWAIAHPCGKPDFHHKDCFALQLKAPSTA